MRLASWRFALSLLTISCLAVSAPSRAQEGEEGEGGGNPTPVGIRGGKSDMRFGDLLDTGDPKSSGLFGRNDTNQRFKDFELELTGCGPAKFRRVKVYPKAVFDEKGELSADSKSDWDVDDDGSGLSDQQSVPDPAAKDTKPPG